MEAETVGVGIIGAGSRGINCIGRQIAEQCVQTGFRLTAMCDRNVDRMTAAAKMALHL